MTTIEASPTESEGTGYDSLAHLQSELALAVKPYRALVRYELKSADLSAPVWSQNLTSPYEYARAYQCRHQQRRPVSWVLSNGVKRVTLQCVACGDKHSSGVRKADYPGALPPIDEGLIDGARQAFQAFRDELQAAYNNVRAEFAQMQQEADELARLAANAEWWAKYTAYLQSPQWMEKRGRVLERDAYVCQACLRREAVHVHHLTYKHVFNEPLFDLIGVCTPCHHALHPHMGGSNGRHA